VLIQARSQKSNKEEAIPSPYPLLPSPSLPSPIAARGSGGALPSVSGRLLAAKCIWRSLVLLCDRVVSPVRPNWGSCLLVPQCSYRPVVDCIFMFLTFFSGFWFDIEIWWNCYFVTGSLQCIWHKFVAVTDFVLYNESSCITHYYYTEFCWISTVIYTVSLRSAIINTLYINNI